MPMLRGFVGDITTLPPDIYVNEMPTPQSNAVTMSNFVAGFIGDFDRGPVGSYVYAQKTPTKSLLEKLTNVFGEASDDGNAGNQLLRHIDECDLDYVVLVRILGEGYETASYVLQDSAGNDALKVSAKYPGEYGNVFAVEVQEDSTEGLYTLVLTSDIGGKETYKDLASVDAAVEAVSAASEHFVVESMVDESTDTVSLATLSKTQLVGGSNGANLTENDYIGALDAGTGKRTGLKVMELAANRVTDMAYIGFSSQKADKALMDVAEKYNSFSYIGVNNTKTVEDFIGYRKLFDSDFCQCAAGDVFALTGAKISAACLSVLLHCKTNVEDSGLAKECIWISKIAPEFDFDQLQELYKNQVAVFTLKPSEAENGALAYRMSSDYTMAKTDEGGNVISDIRVRKVTKRRLNSWIEKSLFYVCAPWQGKAMTKKMLDAAEIRIRSFFDSLVSPKNGDTQKIEDYSVTFDSNADRIDAFIQDLRVLHFNTADWVLLNYQGSVSVEV